MQEIFEKIKERFVKVGNIQFSSHTKPLITVEDAIAIVNQVAEEYNKNIEEPYICRTEVLKLIEDIKCDDRVPKNYGTLLDIMRQIRNMPIVSINNGWIPCSERLPEDGDCRFYMCIVENHEDDLPMFCQFEEAYGFGYWQDFYDQDSLGFIDSEFSTNEELGYEKVIAWQPLPVPYQPKGE